MNRFKIATIIICTLLVSCKEVIPFFKGNIHINLESFPYEFDLQNRTCKIVTAFDSVELKFELKNSEIEKINEAYLNSKIYKIPDSLVLGNECIRLPKILTILKIGDGKEGWKYYAIDMDCNNVKNIYDDRIRYFITVILNIMFEKKEIRNLSKHETIVI